MLALLLIPLIIGGIAFYFLKTVTWKEFLIQIGVSLVMLTAAYFLAKWGALQDIEYLNGTVVSKDKGTQGCCHCRQVCTATNSKGQCIAHTTVCSHSHDYWWRLSTTVGTIGIDSCSGSSSTPKAWSNAVVGEPATVSHMYTNYLLADKESLIRHEVLNKYGKQIPKFPGIHSIYKRNPVISDNIVIPTGWQKHFAELNSKLGNKKQLDLVVLLTRVTSPTYAQAVESKWLYGPKNAFTVVIGTDGSKVLWARGVSFSKVEELKVKIRDDLNNKSLNDVPNIVARLVNSYYKRTPMSDYEYLNKSTTPSKGWMWFLYILAVLLSIGISLYMHKEDVFNEE
jgi:hypothetical protein